MANSCLQLCGFVISCFGWIGILIATATNDWVVTCDYAVNTCKKMDQFEAKGLWAECVISTVLSHCKSLTQLLELPAYIQASRALMITGSLLGLAGVGMILTAMPCISLGDEPQSARNKRSVLGGVLILLVALCGAVSTVWFPIGAHRERYLMSFGFSLYAGWVGTAFSLLGGAMSACCSSEPTQRYDARDSNRFYYSKDQGPGNPVPSSTNHAKSAHV